MAGVPESKITLLAAWESKIEYCHHIAYNISRTCKLVIPSPEEKSHSHGPSTLNGGVLHHPQILAAFTAWRHLRTVLKTSRKQEKKHTVFDSFSTCCKGRGHQFLRHITFWIGTYPLGMLIAYAWLKISFVIRCHRKVTHPFRYILTSKINSLVINLPQQATDRLSSS